MMYLILKTYIYIYIRQRAADVFLVSARSYWERLLLRKGQSSLSSLLVGYLQWKAASHIGFQHPRSTYRRQDVICAPLPSLNDTTYTILRRVKLANHIIFLL